MGSAAFMETPSLYAGSQSLLDLNFLTEGKARLTFHDDGAAHGDGTTSYTSGTIKYIFEIWRYGAGTATCVEAPTSGGDLVGSFTFDYTFGPLPVGVTNSMCADIFSLSFPHKFQPNQLYLITMRVDPGVTGYTVVQPNMYFDMNLVATTGSQPFF